MTGSLGVGVGIGATVTVGIGLSVTTGAMIGSIPSPIHLVPAQTAPPTTMAVHTAATAALLWLFFFSFGFASWTGTLPCFPPRFEPPAFSSCSSSAMVAYRSSIFSAMPFIITASAALDTLSFCVWMGGISLDVNRRSWQSMGIWPVNT